MRFLAPGLAASFGRDPLPAGGAAAKHLNRPVKLVVSRKMMFQTVGHRPHTRQRIRLGATAGAD